MSVQRSAKTVHRITKDDLIFLLNKNDFVILEEVNRQEFGFISYLEKRRYSEQNDEAQMLEVVMRILNRVCSLRGQKTSARLQRFLRMLRDCDKFLFDDVPRVINYSLTKHNGIKLVSFMVNYMRLLRLLLRQDFFPCRRIVEEIFPALENYMNRMRERRLKNLDEAEKCMSSLSREVELFENASSSDDDDDNEIRHFRDLSIVPRSNDIVNYEIPKIPQNIVEGAYKSVDHYLSVHFRLIREDMLRSFRECIKTCISSSNRWVADQNKSHLYESATVRLPPEYKGSGIYYDIVLSSPKEVDWSERREKGFLKPGSLVFLTPDRFQTVIFGTIANNPRTNLSKSKKCEIKIKLEDDTFTDELEEREYEMIEPAAYFECYKHVLSGIKELSESNFPLEDMIVYLDFKDPEATVTYHPEYLEGMQYCLHEKCGGVAEDDSTCCCKVFDPLKDEEWPSANDLELDDKQFIAFKTAITKKVAVIQGPPGTGKTHVGWKVVKTLLQNNAGTPIIICCLTNHALDQFLEGILKMDITKKIVRLGSQSKSEELEPHKMENLMFAAYESRRGNNLSDTLKKSRNLVKVMAEVVLEEKERAREEDEEIIVVSSLSRSINSQLKSYYNCKKTYLNDSALNDIIPSACKDQLRHMAGSILKSLSDSVLEWMLCSRGSDLYAKCDKNFEKFRKAELEFSTKVRDVWALTEQDRYKLFYSWRKKCLEVKERQLCEDIDEYKLKMRSIKKRVADADRLEIMKGADIVGVTTTGACKFKDLIRFSQPLIIVVEEAAQVLEAHIIASLVPSIQHIILIGDHEQLRPLPANHELSEKYKLKVSMFERLFRNGAPSATLVSQHRMKPCIAELLVPVPYETYTSYKNVYEYKEIRGVKSSVFFFDHKELEDGHSSGTSSSNDFEARMIVSFAKYLLLQSYSVKEITILATYSAQVALILKYFSEPLNGIHVTTVDNFQGEQNDIILISFVRSNPSVIGFLKESNRMCVALSRAKMGMFCFGNFQHFANKSDLWSGIVEKLRTKDMISDSLSLKCERHEVLCPVKSDTEISKFIQSGCSQICNFTLPCQHTCTRKCHFYDSDHLQYICKQPCERMMDENRVCKRLCYEKCKRLKKQIMLPCGHEGSGNNPVCYIETPRFLPCRHLITVPCHLDITTYKCKAAVSITLKCGHNKTIHCHEQQEKLNIICTEPRPEMGPCGHIINVPCSLALDEDDLIAFCDKSCGALLECGHACVNFCRFCFDIGIHGFCTEKCDLELSCGHKCKGFCCSPCPPCVDEKCDLTCVHGTKCINVCLRPCSECVEPCARRCVHNRCSKLCYEECNIGPCMEPCTEKLPCGHRCIGMCGEPCPYLCRICNADDLSKNSENSCFVELTCSCVIEVNELSQHIEDCLMSLDWPHCPRCHSKITWSVRYKKQLMQAKKQFIESSDTSRDIAEIRYLVDSMYGEDAIVPARFLPIHNRIKLILRREEPKSNTLLVLRSCVGLLKELVNIAPKLEQSHCDERIHSKFETLLIWLSEHLTNASYQQVHEFKSSVNQLKNYVS